ncbi:peptidase S10 [Sphingomonas sp. NFX23]
MLKSLVLFGTALGTTAVLLPPVQSKATAAPVRSGVFNGQRVAYRVDNTPLSIKTPAGGARIVSFAYLRDATALPADRPVIFLFNGGPIASSIWVHLGVFGPKRVAVPADLTKGAAAYRLVDNPLSPLDAADLVFVDPADTGFSQREAGTPDTAFKSVESDAGEFAAFIRVWLASHDRLTSPVYLVGESYGTVRIPALIDQLAKGEQPVAVDGAMLLGQAVNIVEYSQRPGNIISYAASLPTLTAIAWYHGRIERRGRSLAAAIGEAELYAEQTYLPALFRGKDLPVAERRAVADRLQALTGLPSAYYLAHDLRITKEQFRLELLRDKGLLLGRNDARYVAPVTDQGGRPDPSDVIVDGFQAQWTRYLKDQFGVADSAAYVPLAGVKSLEDWKWGATSPFSDWPYAKAISDQFARNPRFRVLIGNGIFDTQTTIGAADYLRRQSGWPTERTSLRIYPAGHMAYSDPAAAAAIGADIHALVTGQTITSSSLGEP